MKNSYPLIERHPLGFTVRVRGLRIGVNRDCGGYFATGIYQNLGEIAMDFRYVIFQIRHLGQVDFGWTR